MLGARELVSENYIHTVQLRIVFEINQSLDYYDPYIYHWIERKFCQSMLNQNHEIECLLSVTIQKLRIAQWS